MTKAPSPEPFRNFRFKCVVGETVLPLIAVEHEPGGLVLSTFHVTGRSSLFSYFDEYDRSTVLRVEMLPRDESDRRHRHITYVLGEGARHLAVSCKTYLGDYAVDRVLFPNASLVEFRDVEYTDD